MSKVYVLMGETLSPIAFNVPYPVQVYRSKREAEAEAERRNNTPRRQRFYTVRSAEMKEEEQWWT